MNYDTLSNEELDRKCAERLGCNMVDYFVSYKHEPPFIETSPDKTSYLTLVTGTSRKRTPYSPSTNTDQAIEFARSKGYAWCLRERTADENGGVFCSVRAKDSRPRKDEPDAHYDDPSPARALIIATLKALDAKEKA